jgi:hypothetical protein
MIGQNRQAAFQQAEADHDYATVNRLLVENTELTRHFDAPMQALHKHIIGGVTTTPRNRADMEAHGGPGTAPGRGGSGLEPADGMTSQASVVGPRVPWHEQPPRGRFVPSTRRSTRPRAP